MRRRLSSVSLAFTTLTILALSACDENTTPAEPNEQASQTATTAASYSARALGIPESAEFARATSINTAGQVVGYWLRQPYYLRGFIWTNGVPTDLGTLGGHQTTAMDINDLGQVVGSSERSTGRMRAFRWKNGMMTGLGTLGGNESHAFAINSHGHVVGQSRLPGNTRSHAFVFKDGVMSDLGTLGGANSTAMDINDAGQVVGWSETASGARHPFLWENGVMKDLLPPGSASATGTAYAVNPFGVVVGERNNRAFRYSGGVMRMLSLGATTRSVATGIRAGRVVGNLQTPTGPRGFVFADGQVTLLPILHEEHDDEEVNEARAINGAGVIVGSETSWFDGHVHITMWTPQ
jgi:probable HAF family extracellular repeat protein